MFLAPREACLQREGCVDARPGWRNLRFVHSEFPLWLCKSGFAMRSSGVQRWHGSALQLCTYQGKWAGCEEVTQPRLLLECSDEAGISLKGILRQLIITLCHDLGPNSRGIPGGGQWSVVFPAAEEMGPSELTWVQSDPLSVNLILIRQRQSCVVGLHYTKFLLMMSLGKPDAQ